MYIYKITNIINNKIYIGQTTNIEIRWRKHCQNANKKVNRYLYDAMNKYGIHNFKIEVIEECLKENVNEREIFWINQYNSTDKLNGYNMTIGGGGGNTWKLLTPERKQIASLKLTKALKGKKRSPKAIANMKTAIASRTPEQRKVIADKLSKAKRGKVYPDTESRKKSIKNLIQYVKKNGVWMKGKTHSEEVKNRLSISRKGKKIEQIFKSEIAVLRFKEQARQRLTKNNPNAIDRSITPQQIAEYLKRGYNVNQICSIHKISRFLVRCDFRKHFGYSITEFRKKNKLSHRGNYKQKKISLCIVKDMINKGFMHKDIAKYFKVSEPTLRHYIKENLC